MASFRRTKRQQKFIMKISNYTIELTLLAFSLAHYSRQCDIFFNDFFDTIIISGLNQHNINLIIYLRNERCCLETERHIEGTGIYPAIKGIIPRLTRVCLDLCTLERKFLMISEVICLCAPEKIDALNQALN